VRKKLKLPLISEVGKDGVRRYHIAPIASSKAWSRVRLLPARPRPRWRGRSSAQSEQDQRASLAAQVLALPTCSYGELGEKWRTLWGIDPPRHASRVFLVRAVAYGLQAQALGGLDAKTLQLLRKSNRPNGARPKPRTSRLSKGSKLFRDWHGEVHEVLVLDKGFAWRGETYPSLSSTARAITGTHWNGWAFFGLKRRTTEAPANG
jgi:DUF2924 family protein